eukprot:symbB.v1.2.025536.t1/scaffold2483.1/size114807/10
MHICTQSCSDAFSKTHCVDSPGNLDSSHCVPEGLCKLCTQEPCFATQGNGPSDTLLVGSSCVDVPDALSNPPGQPLTFEYRNKDYNQGDGVSYPPFSNVNQFCLASSTSLIFQPNLFADGSYVFVTNATKVVNGNERVSSTSLYVTVLADSGSDATRNPLLTVFLESPFPVFPGATMRFRGEVTNPQNDTTYTFSWSAYRFGLNPQYNSETASTDPTYAVEQFAWAELSEVEFNKSNQSEVRTPQNSNYLVIAPDVFWPGATYKVRLTALDSFMNSQELQDASGYAEFTFRTIGLAPSGGQITVSQLNGSALDTEFLLTMSGWGSEDRPLSYQFSYIQDFESPFADPIELTIAFSDRNFIQTRLPQGLVGSQNLLRVVGIVKSSAGAVATAYADVSVGPASETAILSLAAQIPNLDPETAILYTTLLSETPGIATSSLPPLAQVVEDKMFATTRAVAQTPEAPAASSQSFEQPRWTKRDIEASEGLELGQIFGHQIVASGDVLWCIGGFRPVEQVKISLLALDLSSLRWKDLTPPTNAVAPTWRWGHSACVLGKQAGPRPSRVYDLVMLCGGFDRNCNHNEVWHFCPDSGAFSQPPDALQRLPFHGAYHSLVHDTFSEEVYLFGGQRCVSGHYIYSNSVFVAQLHRHRCGWKELLTSGQKPQARGQHCAVITQSGMMIVYGGSHASATLPDVWTLDVRKTPAIWAEASPEPPTFDAVLAELVATHHREVQALKQQLDQEISQSHREDTGYNDVAEEGVAGSPLGKSRCKETTVSMGQAKAKPISAESWGPHSQREPAVLPSGEVKNEAINAPDDSVHSVSVEEGCKDEGCKDEGCKDETARILGQEESKVARLKQALEQNVEQVGLNRKSRKRILALTRSFTIETEGKSEITLRTIVRHPLFDAFAAVMIILNSVLMGWEAETTTIWLKTPHVLTGLMLACNVYFILVAA